jgi:uncharacterized protein
MEFLSGYEVPLVCGFAFLAGLIDSMVGGGGLIQVPALLTFFPTLPPAMLLGTNKLASIAGSSTASIQYLRKVKVDKTLMLTSAGFAIVFSWCGSRLVSLLDPNVFRPLVLGLLILVAAYTLLRKDFGTLERPKNQSRTQSLILAAAIGIVLGFYDGFFGPGTGSFLIFGYILLIGMDFLRASATSKFVNFSTNLGAVVYFAWTGNILYRLAIPMALMNMLGSYIGSHLAIKKGAAFVRLIFLGIVSALILRLGYQTFFME